MLILLFGSCIFPLRLLNQLKISNLKPIVHYFALHFRFSYCFTKTVVCMGITMRIYFSAVYKICFAIYTNGNIKTLHLKLELALAA